MDVRSLTPVEIADLLDGAWLPDLAGGVDGPDAQTRAALADRLGCDEAEYWLDVEFIQPCPEDRPTKD